MEKPRLPTVRQVALLRGISELALHVKVATIAIGVIALYFQDLNILFTDALNNESTSHVLAVPIIFLYLLYRARIKAEFPIGSIGETEVLVCVSYLEQ